MKFVVFIGAEHHTRYLNFICDCFKIDKDDLYVFFFKSKENLINKTSEIYTYKKLSFIEEFGLNKLLFRRECRSQFFEICSKYFKPDSEMKLFSSISIDYISLFRSKYLKTKVYLLDDGFGFFSNLEYFNSYRKYIHLLRCLLLSFSSLQLIKPSFDIHFFTEYHNLYLDSKNDIIYKRRKAVLKPVYQESNLVIILGSPYVERKLLKIDQYFIYINRVISLYKNSQLLYHPHRAEEKYKLDIIEKYGFLINESKEPFESYLEKMTFLPKAIVSFMSSHAGFELTQKYSNPPPILLIDDLSNKYISNFLRQSLKEQYSAIKFVEVLNIN